METFGSTQRTQKMRENYYQTKPSLCVERAQAFTEVFKETEGEHTILRRAKAFKRCCEKKTISIRDGDLIVGDPASKERAHSVGVDFDWRWFNEELDTISTREYDPYDITEGQKKILREEIFPYWDGKSCRDVMDRRHNKEVSKLAEAQAILPLFKERHGGLVIPNYQRLFKEGYGGIKSRAEDKLRMIDPANYKEFNKAPFYKAVIIACEAMDVLGKRHAEAAREMAEGENNPQRKAELNKIAEACGWVGSNPPRTLQEAVQLLWLTIIGLQLEQDYLANGVPGRIDQFLYPFYKKDLEEGRITKEAALELMECFLLKLGSIHYLVAEDMQRYFPGYGTPHMNITIGGLGRDGKDATNELTYMVLEAMKEIKIHAPALEVRLSRETPEEFWMETCRVLRMGIGQPPIYNDEVGIKSLMAQGVKLEDARDYCIHGCIEAFPQGKCYRIEASNTYSMGHAVEFALNNGKSFLVGEEQFGPETGDASKFTSHEEVEDALKKQLSYVIKVCVMHNLVLEETHKEMRPFALGSALIDGCIENGLDILQGGPEYSLAPCFMGVGTADLADSLAAIKKVVFEDKKISMNDLYQALKNNFEGDGYNDIQRMLLKAPKYGNDDEYVDSIAKKWMDWLAHEITQYKNSRGETLQSALFPVTANVAFGEFVGALPSGRKAKTPLAEGISPKQGMDVKGATSAIKSVTSFSHEVHTLGCLLNQKFDPSVLAGDRGLKNFAALIKTFHDLGGWHLQVNVVSPETLEDARKHPENYQNLMVKVAGYTARYVDLPASIQNDILSRTTQNKF